MQRVEDAERPLRDMGEGQEGELLVALAGLADEIGEPQLERMLRWLSMAPLGGPVVPEV